MPSKYDPLKEYLRTKPRGEFVLSFGQLEEVLGFTLPKTAERPQFWANVQDGSHPHSRSWQDVSFKAFLIAGSRKVRFTSC